MRSSRAIKAMSEETVESVLEEPHQRQYLYFCASKASKLSTLEITFSCRCIWGNIDTYVHVASAQFTCFTITEVGIEAVRVN